MLVNQATKMATLNEKLEGQKTLADEIQDVVVQLKKDPSKTQDLKHLINSKRVLDSLWKKFHQGNEEILEILNGTASDHIYVKQQYYEKIKNIKDKCIDTIEDVIVSFEPNTTMQINAEHTTDTDKVVGLIRLHKARLEALERVMNQTCPSTVAQFLPIILRSWDELSQTHFKIYTECENPENYGYNLTGHIAAETAVLTMQARQDLQASAPILQSASPVQLPKISIAKFDGNYLKWQQFHDIFCKMIHETSIPTIQKMWYLKMNLTGEAERLIRHLHLTEANYSTAWKMLIERFDNKRVTMTALFQNLCEQQIVTNNVSSLKNFHDSIKESLSSLRNLDINIDTWDPLLIYLLSKRLDRYLLTAYEQSIKNSQQIQKMEEFLEFLHQRFLALEAVGVKHTATERAKTSVPATTNSYKRCHYCKEIDHLIYKCDKFRAMTPNERLNWTQKQKLCVNCIRPGHETRTCPNKKCFKCDKKHNTLLHLENKPTAGKTSASVNSKDHDYVLLATAKVNLQGINGEENDFRALLDSGSQVNLISERAIKMLKVKVMDSTLKIKGIGGRENTASRRVSIMLRSKATGFTTRIEAFVLPYIVADHLSYLTCHCSRFQAT